MPDSDLDLDYYVCDRCSAGFREDARKAFVEIGAVVDDNNRCHCGGTYRRCTREQALGAAARDDVKERN